LTKLINEIREYKHSQELFQNIFLFFQKAKRNNKNNSTFIGIDNPASVIYPTPKIKIGFAIYLLSTFSGLTPNQMAQFFDNSNPPYSFVDSAEQVIRSMSRKLYVAVTPDIQKIFPGETADGMCSLTDAYRVAILLSYDLEHEEGKAGFNRTINTIRHELQHLTAMYNGMGIVLYNRLKKAKFDITKMETFLTKDFTEEETTFFRTKISRSKVKLSPKDIKRAMEDPELKTQKEKEFREYVLQPTEYRTFLSDTITSMLNLMFTDMNISTINEKVEKVRNYLDALKKDLPSNSFENVKKLVTAEIDYIDNSWERLRQNAHYKDAIDERMYEMMSVPKLRKQIIKDLKRYMPSRVKKVFQGALGNDYQQADNKSDFEIFREVGIEIYNYTFEE
jgi:hypothetical protein